MVSLEEIKRKRKIKVLLKGLTATGKTYTCMKIVDALLKANKKILYLDHERGAIEEIINYFEDNKIERNDNFIHEDYFGFTDLVENIKKYGTKNKSSDNSNLIVDLIVIDPLPLLQICRISATEQIKKQGFYYMGDKIVKLVDIEEPEKVSDQINNRSIDNRITYSLRGWQYQLPNDWELTFKDVLVSIIPDIVVTLMLPDSKNTLDGSFDYVVEMLRVDGIRQEQNVVNGKLHTENIIEKEYKGIPRKIRGERKTQIVELTDPWKSVIKPFDRKYLNEEGTLEKLGMKEKES